MVRKPGGAPRRPALHPGDRPARRLVRAARAMPDYRAQHICTVYAAGTASKRRHGCPVLSPNIHKRARRAATAARRAAWCIVTAPAHRCWFFLGLQTPGGLLSGPGNFLRNVKYDHFSGPALAHGAAAQRGARCSRKPAWRTGRRGALRHDEHPTKRLKYAKRRARERCARAARRLQRRTGHQLEFDAAINRVAVVVAAGADDIVFEAASHCARGLRNGGLVGLHEFLHTLRAQ